MLNTKRLLRASIVTIALFVTGGNATAGWECYQSMAITEEVSAQSQQVDTGSSMYTIDGHLKSTQRGNRSNTNSRDVSAGNSNYNNNSNSSYSRESVIHYFTICEDNGRIVSIIEHK